MEQELRNLLTQYILKANQACKVLLKGLNLSNKKDLIEYSPKMGDFSLDETKYTYCFHGRGCRLESNKDNIIIDWDFGYKNNCCGINPFLFLYYLEQTDTDSYNKYRPCMKKELENAVCNGEMIIKYDLYYFK